MFIIVPSTFALVAEPSRRQLLSALLDGERSVGSLVTELSMTQPSVSKHLRILREAGAVTVRRVAQQRLYSVRLDALAELDDWLAPFMAKWHGRLDALSAHLDEMDDD